MKKTAYFVTHFIILALAFCATSCISSAYMAGEPKDQIEDKSIVGKWKLQPPKTAKKDDPLNQAIETIEFTASGDKTYKMILPPNPQGEPSPGIVVNIHKVNGENFMTLSNDKEPGKNTYLKYKVEGKNLSVMPLIEEKAAKNKDDFKMGQDKATEFKTEKEFRAMIAKNTKGKSNNMNTKESFKFVKQ